MRLCYRSLEKIDPRAEKDLARDSKLRSAVRAVASGEGEGGEGGGGGGEGEGGGESVCLSVWLPVCLSFSLFYHDYSARRSVDDQAKLPLEGLASCERSE